MLVPDQYINIKMNGRSISFYNSLGYTFEKGEEIDVAVEDLPKCSAKKVKIQCDFCGKIFDRCYKDYIISQQTGSDACCDCTGKKVKETCMNKYGVEGVMCLEDNKNKSKNTLMTKYGVENISQCQETKEKIKKTVKTKYGVNHIAQLDSIKEKKKNTNLVKYGFENPSSSKVVRKKVKDKFIEIYGVDHPMQTKETKEKLRQSILNKYGVENYSQTQEYKDKIKETNLKKYGVTYVFLSPEIKEKCLKSQAEHGKCKTSSQQNALYKTISNKYQEAILNYPCGYSIFDIAILLNNDIKIDIEYDCWYWHQNQQKDRRRNYYNISRGWKVLRVKGGYKLPNETELFDAIDYLINTEHHYKEIILDDWKEPNKEDVS